MDRFEIEFQSTLPVWGGTPSKDCSDTPLRFQSTLPVWGGTENLDIDDDGEEFQSTLPVWGGTAKNNNFYFIVFATISHTSQN